MWKKTVEIYRVFEPVRFSLLVVILIAIVFLYVQQGVEILRGLGERDGYNHQFQWYLLGRFYTALILLAIANWYWTRFLLNCDFSQSPSHLNTSPMEKLLRLHVPRLLGIVPVLIVSGGFCRAAHSYNTPGVASMHWLLAAGSLVLTGLLYDGFIRRRRWLKQPQPTPKYKTIQNIIADQSAFRAVTFFSFCSVVLLILFCACAVPFGLWLGSGAVLLLALASLVGFGSTVVYFGHRFRLPVMTIVLGIAFISSFFNDNHDVRKLVGSTSVRINLSEALDAWYAQVQTNFPSEASHPLYIVATEGGGIRAAYWTALVLGNLEDATFYENKNSFSAHLFAISGVSGGSLGGALFVGLVADPIEAHYVERTHWMLDRDFLAPTLGKMFFPDLLQRLIPVRFQCLDRAHALEEAWEYAWQTRVYTDNLFGKGFTDLYCNRANNTPSLPSLFLNGTSVETGGRIITSNLKFQNASSSCFIAAIDGLDKMNGVELRLSTAVHDSARFTYISPAGRFPDGTHVVDGGYFENSAALTAQDLLKEVQAKLWTNVVPVSIIIENDPVKIKPADTHKPLFPRGPTVRYWPPVTTLFNARSAHANLALGELQAEKVPARLFSA